MADVRRRHARLIAGVHILHKQSVLDETGTISVRNRNNPAMFVTSSLAPVLTSSPDDLDEWYVADASLVIEGRNGATASLMPRNTENIHIHSSIYARYPEVQSIGHIRTMSLLFMGCVMQTGPCCDLCSVRLASWTSTVLFSTQPTIAKYYLRIIRIT